MSIQLTVMSLDFEAGAKPQTSVFDKEILTVGSSDENDIVLNRPEVSTSHAVIRLDETTNPANPVLYITDLGSSNGTMVENHVLRAKVEVAMLPNERIIIGNYLIKPTVLKEVVKDKKKDIELEKKSTIDTQADTLEIPAIKAENGNYKELQITDAPTAIETNIRQQSLKQEIEITRIQPEETSASVASTIIAKVAETPTKTNPAEVIGVNNNNGSDNLSIKVKLDGSGLNNLDFQATELFSLKGVVTYKGSPLSGVEIDGGAFGAALSSSDGSFVFSGIKEGSLYQLQAAKAGYRFDISKSNGCLSHDTSVNITAVKVFDVRGRVLHKGHPLTGVRIEAGDLGASTTDSEGSFVFTNVPEDRDYYLTAAKSEYIFECNHRSGRVLSSNVDVTFNARQLFTISGKIMHKGLPLVGAEVDGGNLGKTITGQDGVYRFENVPEGADYSITAHKPGFVFQKS